MNSSFTHSTPNFKPTTSLAGRFQAWERHSRTIIHASSVGIQLATRPLPRSSPIAIAIKASSYASKILAEGSRLEIHPDQKKIQAGLFQPFARHGQVNFISLAGNQEGPEASVAENDADVR